MIDTKALRSRILDLAIQGKLTEQLESDGTAQDIIANLPPVSAKRKTLLKKSFEYDDLYDIPNNWSMIELGKISSYGDSPIKAMVSDTTADTWLLELEDIKSGGILLNKKRVGTSTSIGEKTVFKKNQILYSKLRPYLKKVLIADENGISTPELISFDVFCGINPQYIVYCLTNDFVDKMINNRSYGVKMPRVDVGFMVNLPIPLPPLAEQKRIVERVEEIFRLLDTIDEAQEKYSADSQILKAKLITAGIQGKLTKQLESDGTAHELYQKIQEEKQKLIKEGKLKKEKPLPPISPDEIPFEIPQNWMWVRINDIFAVGTGSTPSKNEKKYYNGGDIPWVNSALTVNRYIEKVNTYITEYALNSLNLKLYAEHTLIIAMYGEGKTRGQISELLIPATTNQACAALSSIIYHQETINYVFYFFQNYYDSLRALAHGGNQPNLNLQKIKDVLIPLPPLAEQKRIADVLERALGVFE